MSFRTSFQDVVMLLVLVSPGGRTTRLPMRTKTPVPLFFFLSGGVMRPTQAPHQRRSTGPVLTPSPGGALVHAATQDAGSGTHPVVALPPHDVDGYFLFVTPCALYPVPHAPYPRRCATASAHSSAPVVVHGWSPLGGGGVGGDIGCGVVMCVCWLLASERETASVFSLALSRPSLHGNTRRSEEKKNRGMGLNEHGRMQGFPETTTQAMPRGLSTGR